MATMAHEPTPRPLADDGSNHLLLEVGRAIRDNLHTLFVMSLLFLGVALPWVMLGTFTSWAVAWAPLVLSTAPVWATIVASADRMLAGETSPWRIVGNDLRRLALPAIHIGLLPAIYGTVLLALSPGMDEALWTGMVVLVMAGIAVAIIVLLIPAGPLAFRHNLAGLTLWQASAFIVVQRPMQVLGTVIVTGLGVWMALVFGPAALLGAAPLGVLVAGITLPDPE